MPNPADKRLLLQALRTAIRANGGKRLGIDRFLATTRLKPRDVYRHFSTWGHALRAAGINDPAHNAPVDDAVLLADWGAVARKLKHIPTVHDYQLHGKHSSDTFRRRFGPWDNVLQAFRTRAAKNPKLRPFLKHLSPTSWHTRRQRNAVELPPHRRSLIQRRKFPHRPICGDTLDFGPLRHAPTNEHGVIFLFGMLAARLGFIIEGFQSSFPDCYAKRLIAPGTWQPVTIEFEYESRNFREHHHPTDGCDIIVCWTHNWADCPKNLEVIALKDELKCAATSEVTLVSSAF